MIRTTLLDRDNLTYRQCCSRLLDHSLLIKHESSTSTSAYYASKKGGNIKEGDGIKNVNCYSCGEKGHISSQCKLKPKDKRNPICYSCKESGHIAPNCPKKKGGEGEKVTFLAVVEPQALVTIKEIEAKPMEAHNANHHDTSTGGWIIDSGATHHMCKDKGAFISARKVSGGKRILLGDSSHINVELEGRVDLSMSLGGRGSIKGQLDNVLYTPNMSRNLFSVTHCVKQGNDVYFNSKRRECSILRGGRIVGRARLQNNLWVLNGGFFPQNPDQDHGDDGEAHLSEMERNIYLWHLRLGHLGEDNLKLLKSKGMVKGLSFDEGETFKDSCFGCAAGKHHRKPFIRVEEKKKTDLLELIHSDLIGPLNPKTPQGKAYVLTFIDDSSRRSWIYLLSTKGEVFLRFKEWKSMVEKQTGKFVKILRSDNGGEYESNEFKDYLIEHGILHQTSVARSPQQNGLAERFNKTLMEMARSMIHGANLPRTLWGEAVQAANYLKNRSPHAGLKEDMTPHEAFTGVKPYIGHLRVFGSKVYVHIPRSQRSKLGSRAWAGIFVGYAPEQRGYKVWRNNRTNIIVSRDLIFLERDVMNVSKEGVLTNAQKDVEVILEKETPPQVEPEENEVTITMVPLETSSKGDANGKEPAQN